VSDTIPAFETTPFDFPPIPAAATPEPAHVPVVQIMPEVSAPAVAFSDSFATESFTRPETTFAPPEVPVPVMAEPNPVTAQQFPSMMSAPQQQFAAHQQPTQPSQQQVPQQPTQLWNPPHEVEIAVNAEHPFRQYWGVPNANAPTGLTTGQTKITGRPISVAELLAGTWSPVARTQLLQAYWELSGLLAIYHFRLETERLASGAMGQQQDMMTLLREQRRTAEIEFIKQQWVLAELLTLHKGQALRESELPIPSDFPLYPRYQTHADILARTERARHLGRMIPIQERLIETKNGTWRAASEMIPGASQPFFVVSTHRTMAFLDLTRAIVDYNKMIAEYAMETIPPHVSQQQLVGAVVRLPRTNTDAVPEQSQAIQMATEGIRLTQYEAPVGVPAQPIAQVAHEFQAHELHLGQQPTPTSPPSEVVEIEESGFTPMAPPFLMGF